MSLPEFPTTTPPLSREDAINQIISSIAMEELSLSHIINAEGEKLQYVLGTIPGITGPSATIEDVLKINESVRAVLQDATESQTLLRSKLEQVLNSGVLTGPTGPRGPSGPVSVDVERDINITGPGGQAFVENIGGENDVKLEFTLPRGSTGPSGSTGPANGLNAFAGIYNNADVVISNGLTADEPFAVVMPLVLDSKNITTNENRITIEEAGTYYIGYGMFPNFTAAATVTLEVRSNGTTIVPTLSTATATITSYAISYSGNTIAVLPEGAVIDMVVTSTVNQTMTFAANAVEILTVLKLN